MINYYDALGEVRLYPAGGIPANWLPCNGQTLKVNDYLALSEFCDPIDDVSFRLPVMHSPFANMQYIICTFGVSPLDSPVRPQM